MATQRKTDKIPNVRSYVSQNVFDGVRALSANEKRKQVARVKQALAKLSGRKAD